MKEYVIREGIHIILSVSCIVICLCATTGTYVWRQMLKIYLKRLIALKFVSNQVHQSEVEAQADDPTKRQNTVKPEVKNTDGELLAFKNEADIYFKQLNAAWE